MVRVHLGEPTSSYTFFMWINSFEERLSGGHPNSLGNTVDVVDDILADRSALELLFQCYGSDDPVVRLRVSNAMKRVCKAHPDWVAPYLDRLISQTSIIDQASTKWTLSTLFMLLDTYMSPQQRKAAITVMKNNLLYDDWIVQNTTADSLFYFAKSSPELSAWLVPQLQVLQSSRHKSVSQRVTKLLSALEG
jgi:hypothetical protein